MACLWSFGSRTARSNPTACASSTGRPQTNDFFLASQVWLSGDLYKRRADLVGFVNGLPLLFVELKAAHKALEDAFNGNLADYRATIPHVFTPTPS